MLGMVLSLFFWGFRWRQAGWMPWTPYADWIFTLVSTASMLLIVWLVLRPRQ